MAKISKNLGIVSAIHIGTTAPTNIYLLWYNISDGFHYYFDTITEGWEKLKSNGGSEGLSETLAFGNITGGNDIKISTASGDSIVFVNADQTKSISLFANPVSGNYTQTFQDKSGTIALTSDITATLYNGNGTVGVGRVATLTDFIAFNGGEFRTENGYWQGTNKILYINPNGTAANLFVGQSSGNSTMTGTDNTGLGLNTLLANTTGLFNNAVGRNALRFNTTGNGNNAFGYYALALNTTGLQNSAFGNSSLESNTSGTGNVAMGQSTLQATTTTGYNTAIGYVALQFNETSYNTGVGAYAGRYTTAGEQNVFVGAYAGTTNTTGSYNVIVGYNSFNVNTTGANNTALGHNSMTANTTGAGNTSIGKSSLTANTTGTENVALGYQSFYTNTVGSNNVGLGAYAGYYETGSNKLFIDNTARANEADGRAKALIYGIFDAATANQRLYINANIGRFGLINVGSDTVLNTILWNSTAIPTIATGTRNTLIGNHDTGTVGITSGMNNTMIGSFTSNLLTTGNANLLITTYATPNLISGSTNIWLGECSTTNTAINQSLAFNGKPTLNSQVVFGDPNIARYNSFYFGQGMITPDSYGKFDVNFYATSNQSGETDKNATVSNFIINASQGTGTGLGGNIVFKTSPIGATGNTQNPLLEALTILGSRDINTPLAHYNYMAASNSADTVGDVRFYATYVATVSSFIIEKCTVANATKGAGTWVNINSFSL